MKSRKDFSEKVNVSVLMSPTNLSGIIDIRFIFHILLLLTLAQIIPLSININQLLILSQVIEIDLNNIIT